MRTYTQHHLHLHLHYGNKKWNDLHQGQGRTELKVVRIQYFSSLPGDFLLAAEGGVFRDHQKKNDLPL